MGNILAINTIADDREKAKEITNRVIQKGDKLRGETKNEN